MNIAQIDIDWLIERAKQEEEKIKPLSRIKFIISTAEEIAEHERDCAKALGRVDMIREIVAKIKSETESALNV